MKVWPAALLLFAGAACAPSSPRGTDPVSEVRAVWTAQGDAWNRGDLEGFMEGYWKSPDLVFFSNGSETRGWQETLDRYRASYKAEGRQMGTLDFPKLEFKELSATVVLARGQWRLKMPDGKESTGMTSVTFQKLPEGWRIVHDHSSAAVNTPGTAAASGKVLRLGEMTWQEIDALNRDKTLFLLAVGMVEEHGPHLPTATDTIGVEHEAARVAERLVQLLPDWNIVAMPAVNYGSSGINQVGDIAIHPGTYGIRQSTLRSLIADIGGQVAQNRFKWIFVMSGHGAPTHHTAVNDASDFVSDRFNATMLNISGLFTADAAIQARGQALAARHFSQGDLSSFGFDNHAGVSETSGMLAIRPDLVRSSYRDLPSYRVENRTEVRSTASKPGWPGYFSSPGRANAAYGRDVETWWVEGMTDLIVQAVHGENLRTRPRWPGNVPDDPEFRQFIDFALRPERDFEASFARWFGQRK